MWAVHHKADNRIIGFCGLVPQRIGGNLEVELGYKLAKEYWNQGLSAEAAQAVRAWAFEHLEIQRIISIIDPANMASQRVAEKNGMMYSQNVEYDGKTCHVYTIQRRPS